MGRPDYDLGARTRTDTGARTANRDLDARSSAGVRSDRSDTNRAPTRADINRQLGIREDARVRTDADVRGNANLRDNVRGRVDADGRASANLRDTARARTDADVRGNANLRDRDNARASARAEARNSALLNNPEWMRSIRTDTRTAQTSLARALDRQINVTDRDGVRDRGTARSAWLNDHPDRAERWGRYGNSYRNNWYRNRYYGGNLFGSRFWGGRNLFWPSPYFNYLGLGYGYGGYGGYGQWWGQPSWFGLNRFFGGGWGYGNYAWGAPIYYDYGPGGNLVYLDDGVYYNDTYIASTDAYAASAAQLAYVDPDQVSEQPGDWMPLGTFALITNPENDQMKRFVQLAVDEQGFVAGTLYNRDTDKAYAITGRVDKNTQRVAFRSDSNPDLVYETGIYNLTQDETPLLVHDGREEPTTFLLVRLEQPEGSDIRSAERVDSYDR